VELLQNFTSKVLHASAVYRQI